MNTYSVLGVAQGASADEVKQAYRRMAMKYHPDRNSDADAKQKFQEVQEAYQEITNPKPQRQTGGFGGFDFSDMGEMHDLGDLFAHVFGTRQQGVKQPFVIEVTVPFARAILGGPFTFSENIPVTCHDCSGTGAENGDTTECSVCHGQGRVSQTILGGMRMQKQCNACQGRGKIPKKTCKTCKGSAKITEKKTWDLNLPPMIQSGMQAVLSENPSVVAVFDVDEHPNYTREGSYIVAKAFVRASMAALGGEITIPNLEGGTIKLPIPRGVQHGEALVVRGGLGKNSVGQLVDAVAVVHIQTPTKLSKEQEKILRDFEKTFSKK